MIPLGDRQIAMSLLLELALQRGTLSHILDALLLLLRLSDTPPFATDKNRRLHKSEEEEEKEGRGMRELKASEMSFPLVPFLRRLSCICTPPSPFPSHNKKAPEVKVRTCVGLCVFIYLQFSHFELYFTNFRILPLLPSATWSAIHSLMMTPPRWISGRWLPWQWLILTALLNHTTCLTRLVINQSVLFPQPF